MSIATLNNQRINLHAPELKIPVTSAPSHEDTVEELVPVAELVELLVDVFVVVVLVVGNPGAKKPWSLPGDGVVHTGHNGMGIYRPE